MKSTKQLSVRMIPALESRSRGSEIGDIGLVPAVRAEISYGDVSVSTIAVIDTGADVSCLDKSLFKVLKTRRPERTKLIMEASGHPSLPIYNFNVKIKGEPEGLNFENVPVAVGNLGRSVFIIGRRGILEWLRIELDFPNAQVKLILSQSWASKYPYLANEFPKFESAIENIEAQRIQEGITMLAWDMERFLDRLMVDDKELRGIMDEVPLSHRNIKEKLIYVCQAKKIKDLSKEIEEFVSARNNAVHARVFESGEKLSTESVLKSAEKIVSRLSLKIVPSLHNQTPPEENFVGREKELEIITSWYKSEEVRIGALIGWGGVGKSALVRKWYDKLEANKIRPDGIFWWGFYRNANLELFLNALLRYVSGGQIEPETIKSTWEKVERIKEYIGRGAYLIILDGLEEMQKGESGEEFGRMIHREFAELLHYLADAKKSEGLCLITTRYELKDINQWYKNGFEWKQVTGLSVSDSLRMLKLRGIKGTDEDLKEVARKYKRHPLSLTSTAGFLDKYHNRDIKQAPDIEFVLGDKERFKDVNKLLNRYAEKMSETERVFLNIFSLFRKEITERDFEGVFRKRIDGTRFNDVLVKMSELDFRDLIGGLVDWRLIWYHEAEKTYSTHPLIKVYFESDFKQRNKKLCHKRIYKYFGGYAPDEAETLENMQPLFEQVYHGCAAGLYDEVFDEIFQKKLDRGEAYIVHKLGAWNTALSVMLNFFPSQNLSRVPQVSKKRYQSYLLNNTGLALLSTGRPKEAEGPLLTGVEMNIEADDWVNASRGYQNLADLRFRTGEVEAGLDSAQKALKMAEKAKNERFIMYSKAYLGWIYYLLGKIEEAEKNFKGADELFIKVTGNRIHSMGEFFYADFLRAIGRIDEAYELTRQNLEVCKKNNWTNDISSCHRCLGAIERTKGNKKRAEGHLKNALEIARKVSLTWLEIEVLLETGRLCLDMGKYEDAIRDASQILKICGRTGFRFYEPRAEIVLAKTYLAEKDIDKAEVNAKSAYKKAAGMKYRWAEGDAGHLLGEIYLAMGRKRQAGEQLKKAAVCRKKIKDPKVKETETLLEGLS